MLKVPVDNCQSPSPHLPQPAYPLAMHIFCLFWLPTPLVVQTSYPQGGTSEINTVLEPAGCQL